MITFFAGVSVGMIIALAWILWRINQDIRRLDREIVEDEHAERIRDYADRLKQEKKERENASETAGRNCAVD